MSQSPEPQRPQGAIFDLGNTLLRWVVGPTEITEISKVLGSSLGEHEAVQLWAQLTLNPVTATELGMGAGWSDGRYRQRLLDYYESADERVPGLADWLARAAVDPDRYQAFPGARELVADLAAAEVRLGVISDTGFDIRPVLAANGLRDLQPHVVLSHEVGACKPESRLFAFACSLIGTTAGQTVMIEDDPHADGGAAAAGLTTLILPALGESTTRDYNVVRSVFGV